ncbi:MAG: hypothetical protein F4W95_06975 [Chloroflexi bacterium]|nr:hypothetical protein [Chloroflexota bacterium]MYD48212.1 hypothetical protein [Chloroflexota bacterium]
MIFYTLAKGNASGPLGILSLAGQAGNDPADLSFLAYLDVWIIGGLVLLAVVVVVGKWLWGQWRRRNEADEQGYYDGYDPYYDREWDLDSDYDDSRN